MIPGHSFCDFYTMKNAVTNSNYQQIWITMFNGISQKLNRINNIPKCYDNYYQSWLQVGVSSISIISGCVVASWDVDAVLEFCAVSMRGKLWIFRISIIFGLVLLFWFPRVYQKQLTVYFFLSPAEPPDCHVRD